MKTAADFFHAACPVGVAAELKSVSALVIAGQPFHINFDAAIADLK